MTGLFIDNSRRRQLAVVVYAFAAFVFVAAATMSARGIYLNSAAAKLSKTLKVETMELSQERLQYAHMPKTRLPEKKLRAVEALEHLQSAVSRAANANGCQVVSVGISGTPSPFVSHFGGFDATAYEQTTMQVVLHGPMSGIVAALQDLSTCDVPFEFGTMDFSPAPPQETKKVTPRTGVTMRFDCSVISKKENKDEVHTP